MRGRSAGSKLANLVRGFWTATRRRHTALRDHFKLASGYSTPGARTIRGERSRHRHHRLGLFPELHLPDRHVGRDGEATSSRVRDEPEVRAPVTARGERELAAIGLAAPAVGNDEADNRGL